MATSPSRITDKRVRRRQLVESTIDSIAKVGLSETTLARVARGAGLSQGIVNFHFRSKKALLTATLQHLADEYRAVWQEALAGAPREPAGRLEKLIMADFDPRVFNRKKIAVWMAFLGEARARPTYLELCAERDRAYFDALRSACAEVLADDGSNGVDPDAVADGIQALTDGLWLDHLVEPRRMPRGRARAVTYDYLAFVFPRHFQHESTAIADCA